MKISHIESEGSQLLHDALRETGRAAKPDTGMLQASDFVAPGYRLQLILIRAQAKFAGVVRRIGNPAPGIDLHVCQRCRAHDKGVRPPGNRNDGRGMGDIPYGLEEKSDRCKTKEMATFPMETGTCFHQ